MDAAIKHSTAGIGIWPWASNDHGSEPDVVMACCGDVPTLETLAAVEMLREFFPDLKVRVINVVDLMKLQHALARYAALCQEAGLVPVVEPEVLMDGRIPWSGASFDGWATANDLETREAGFGCWFGDLPSDQLQDGARIIFTFLWQEGWEGKEFHVELRPQG